MRGYCVSMQVEVDACAHGLRSVIKMIHPVVLVLALVLAGDSQR